jgi:hypothetical protein
MSFRALVVALLVLAGSFAARPVVAQFPSTTGDQTPAGSTVRGKVRYSDTGNPVRRADVRLLRLEGEALQRSGTTNRKGEFVFENVPAGRYFAIVESPNLVSPVLSRSWDDLWNDWLRGEVAFGCAEVVVSSGGAPAITILAQRGGAITGRIIDAQGSPIPDAEMLIYAVRDDKVDPEEITYRIGVRTKTDDRGYYRIGGLLGGTYVVRVNDSKLNLPERTTEFSSYIDGSFVAAYYPDVRSLAEATPVEVVTGQGTSGIDIRFRDEQTHRVSGRIVFGPNSLPLQGVYFRLFRKDEEPLSTEEAESPTPLYDNQGDWSVSELVDGDYVALVRTTGQTQVAHPNGDRTPVNIIPKRFDLSIRGADVSGLTIEMEEAAVLRGKVNFIGARPEDVDIRLEAVPKWVIDGGIGRGDAEWISSVADIGYDGTFAFGELRADDYYLRLKENDRYQFALTRVTLNRKELTGKPLAVSTAQPTNIEITLTAAAATVTAIAHRAANDQTPLGDVLFFIVPAAPAERRLLDHQLLYRADPQGRIAVRFRPGEYLVTAARRQPGRPLNFDEDFWLRNAARLQHIKIESSDRTKTISVTLEAAQPTK